MNNEQQPKNYEHAAPTPESTQDHERLKRDLERAAELSRDKEQSPDSVRHEIEQIKVEQEKKTEKQVAPASAERPISTKKTRQKAYNTILKQTQGELSAPSRAFSKLIHNPVVDKVSEVFGSTVARPNAILAGAAFSFLLTLAIYLIARMNGYPLSGTETIAAFIGGWGLGLIFDFFKIMITGKR
jgi:hypothetical protein